jgi:hypothetical protein
LSFRQPAELPDTVPGAAHADRHYTFRRYSLTPGQVVVSCYGNDHVARCVVHANARWVDGMPPSWRAWEDHIVRHRQGWLVESSTGPRPFGPHRTTAMPTAAPFHAKVPSGAVLEEWLNGA